MTKIRYTGGCHCGRVRFEVQAPPAITAHDCNCSMCRKSGFLHLIVPKAAFRLISGTESLQTYTFNTGVAQHLFCRQCGVKSFYIPRSNPDGVDVNVRCLDQRPEALVIEPFDGENWEAHAQSLAHLSNDA